MAENKYKELLKDKIKTNNKYHIRTYGCQMNEHDSEQVEFILENIGLVKTENIDEANIILINTCAIRGTAENKAFGFLGSLKNLKRNKSDVKLIVSGCLPKIDDAFDNLINKNKHIDILMGTTNYNNLPDLLLRSFSENKTIVDVSDQYDFESNELNYNRMYNHKSFVNIMYGCNNFCSYCIVPYTRGREISRKKEDIISEITTLASEGVKEITLLGQNVNSYGKTLEEKSNLAELILAINDIDGIERIRFMTSHPKDISDDLINLYSKLDKLSNHLHLPVQSGSNKVLEDMNRRYTRENYLEKINKVKSINDEIGLSTDIIIGFPGETDEDFLDTLNLVKEVKFDSIFIFLYSPREGTPSAKREDQIPHDVKMKRFNELTETINKIALEKNQKYLNKTVKVLVDEKSKTNENVLTGRTESFKTVNFEGNEDLIGQIVDVKIDEVGTFSLNGKVV